MHAPVYIYRHCVEYIKPTLLCASLAEIRLYRQGLQACSQYVGKICMNGLYVYECIIYTTPINPSTVPRGINRRKMKSYYEAHSSRHYETFLVKHEKNLVHNNMQASTPPASTIHILFLVTGIFQIAYMTLFFVTMSGALYNHITRYFTNLSAASTNHSQITSFS